MYSLKTLFEGRGYIVYIHRTVKNKARTNCLSIHITEILYERVFSLTRYMQIEQHTTVIFW